MTHIISISLLLGICQHVCATSTNVTNGVLEAELFARDADAGPNRTLFSIVWGCASTIFLCSWTSIHTAVPPRRGFTTINRLEMMAGAITVPGLLPVAAFGQLLGAIRARDLYNGPNQSTKGKWTLKHGYFLVMGGFHLVEPQGKGDAKQGQTFVLTLEMLEELRKRGQDFEIPVTVEEIADKSKSDALSKAIFVFQATWFIAQCITRHCQGLGLTALELTTAGLASLNILTFFLWWSKPLAVEVPLRVDLKACLSPGVKNAGREKLDPLFPRGCRDRFLVVMTKLSSDAFLFGKGTSKFVSVGAWLLSPLLIFPFTVMLAVCAIIDIIMMFSFPEDATYVPIYYVPRTLSPRLHFRIQFSLLDTLMIAVGGIHCAGWNMEFPTHIEQLLWRYSSLLVTVVPVLVLTALVTPLTALHSVEYIFNLIRYICDPQHRLTGLPPIWQDEARKLEVRHEDEIVQTPHVVRTGVEITLTVLCAISGLAFAVARLALIGLAVAQLRNVSPSARLPIKWSEFYPHI